jgi:hypothetical protein
MKTTILVVVTCLLVVAGCNSDSPKVNGPIMPGSIGIAHKLVTEQFQLSTSVVDLSEYTVDSTQAAWTFRLSINFDDSTGGKDDAYILQTAKTSGHSGSKDGFRHTLYDKDEEMLFEVEYEYDTLNTKWIKITERTPDDQLQITVSEGRGVTEKYKYLNGDSCVLNYPMSLKGHMDGSCCVSVEDAMLRDSLREVFKDFYVENSGLDDNVYGSELMELVTNPDYGAWSDKEFPTQMSEAKALNWHKICDFARACAYVKCLLMPGNSICAVCAFVAAVCEIFGYIYNNPQQ